MSQGGTLNAAKVLALFQELSDRLAGAGVAAQLFVVGGAAMALAYDDGRVTRDVDALFVPAPEVRQVAEDMSIAHGLEPDWLNAAAKGFLPGDDESPRTVFESESLLVQVPSAQYLLAMKLHASRDERDLDDAAVLFNRLGYSSGQDCIDLLTQTYPLGQLLPRHRYLAEEVAHRAISSRQQRESKATRTTEFDDPWKR
ncbi:MAG: nucleotidyl transferase [Actinomycetales bacterium]|nr:nucleotidyl transferase [Actinomycetales bacterium]